MPTISSFYGIKICMYIDHLPPHIHIYYENEDYRFNLKTGHFIDKNAPKILKKLIIIWYNEHKDELLEAWEIMQVKKEVRYIEPLK